MNSHIHTLVTAIDFIVLFSLILSSPFTNCIVECVFVIFFLCPCMLPHYLKLEPSWLRCEAAWVAYSTLIFHICTLVATTVDLIVLFDIVLSFPSSNHVIYCVFIIFFFVPLPVASSL